MCFGAPGDAGKYRVMHSYWFGIAIGIGFGMHRIPIAIPIPIPTSYDKRLFSKQLYEYIMIYWH
jgi:hypothetical protein